MSQEKKLKRDTKLRAKKKNHNEQIENTGNTWGLGNVWTETDESTKSEGTARTNEAGVRQVSGGDSDWRRATERREGNTTLGTLWAGSRKWQRHTRRLNYKINQEIVNWKQRPWQSLGVSKLTHGIFTQRPNTFESRCSTNDGFALWGHEGHVDVFWSSPLKALLRWLTVCLRGD